MRLGFVASDLGEAAFEHQDESRVQVDVPRHALPRLVVDLREHKPADPAPAQDLAVGEIPGRLRDNHVYRSS
jgi:hypothetical protein